MVYQVKFIILIFISCSTTNQEVSLDYSKKSPKELLRLSVEGVPEAQTALGTLHYHGRGVPQDFKEAVRWYRIAADQKLVEAQFNLGLMYYHGRGVQQDYKRAIRWIRFAAEEGLAEAQFNLGLIHYNGHGVSQSFIEAASW